MLNNFRNRFIFCTNVDIDEVLLLYKNKGLRINSFGFFFFAFVTHEKAYWWYAFYLAK